ncbi:hypothetical protein GcM3_029022 [Golovinomyces cichoracearum]|uniref:Uncharacterized protein n=1 Tax=Golovinomyces cichoracearum TaxID=62708 RepID=A0A420J5A3_9PEZI|nr:hypothetical protein GcM3_029022 [Golovinomyces cichoracearum]
MPEADHRRDLGPAVYWWVFPMEQYFSDLKARLTNTSWIDANLVHVALKIELLHHLARLESEIGGSNSWPKLRQKLPHTALTMTRGDGSKVIDFTPGTEECNRLSVCTLYSLMDNEARPCTSC